MDTLVTIVFFVIAVIVSAILKRKQGADETPEAWPSEPPTRTGSQPASPRPARTWEEELRRLLEGHVETAPPPPPIEIVQPSPKPPPLSVPARPRAVVQPGPRPSARPRRVVKDPLAKAHEHYERASQLDLTSQSKLEEAARQLQLHAKMATRREVRPEIRDALRLMQSPQSLRIAVVASIILGTPKGLSQEL